MSDPNPNVRAQSQQIAQVLIQGDLKTLSPEQKVAYYLRVCESLGLNPYTKPLAFLEFEGVTQLYTRKDATDQLRRIHQVSIVRLERQITPDMVVVTAEARTAEGRIDTASGAVWIKGVGGNFLANALMRAETKAKRRVTLSICGLGLTDESEIDTLPGATLRLPDLPELPPADEAYVPFVARDPGDAPRPPEPQPEPQREDKPPPPRNAFAARLISSADDPVWQRWLVVSAEARGLGVADVPNLVLPKERTLLVSTGLKVAAAIKARRAELAEADAEREVGARKHAAWERNRALMGEAYAAGVRLHELASTTDVNEIEQRNAEIEGLLDERRRVAGQQPL